jgi:hypothetical protein
VNTDLHDALARALDSSDDLVHPTYRHLTRRMKIAGLELPQWGAIVACCLLAYGLYRLIPGGGQVVFAVAVFAGGLPAIWSLISPDLDLSLTDVLRSAIRWRRGAGVYLPGCSPQAAPDGYRVTPDPTTSTAAPSGPAHRPEDLWR